MRRYAFNITVAHIKPEVFFDSFALSLKCRPLALMALLAHIYQEINGLYQLLFRKRWIARRM